MPRFIQMPTEGALPRGARRDFVSELHNHYRAANRPALRLISERASILAARNEKLAGTASRETIRRMLEGLSLPTWATVEVVFLALCDIAGRDPNEQCDDSYESWTYRDNLSRAWNDAVDEPLSQPRKKQDDDDPWATGSNGGWGTQQQPF